MGKFAEQALEMIPGAKACNAVGVVQLEMAQEASLFWIICVESSTVSVTVLVLSTVSIIVAVTATVVEGGLISLLVLLAGEMSVETFVDL